ncbi:MAG: hypothetical protein ACWGQW_07550 [bacterium]
MKAKTYSVLIWCFVTGAAVGQEKPGIDSSTEVFYSHVRFTDSAGNTLKNIKPEEIGVQVNGEPVPVTGVLLPDEPFDVGLVMDVSPSKEGEVDPIRQATDWFVSLFPLQNRILILTFDSDIYLDCDWTTDRKKVQEAIWEYGLHKPGSSTILYETVVAAIDQKFLSRKPRTVMILFTDGVDTGSKSVTDEESIEFMADSNVLTYCIQHFSFSHYWRSHAPGREEPDIRNIPGPSGTKMGPILVGGRSDRDWAEYKINTIRDRAVKYIGRLSRAGGGQHIQLANVDELERAYARIFDDLADVFTVTFVPPKGTSKDHYRSVTISTTREGVLAHPLPKRHWMIR